MLKKYWKIAAAVVFLTVAGFCYGIGRLNDETVPLPEYGVSDGEMDAGRSGYDSESVFASGAAGFGTDASEMVGSGTTGSGVTASETAGSGAVVSETPAAEMTEPAACYVHVCGEVAEPGVYVLPAGSRVFEAIKAAGGLTENASERSLNLAAPVSDGMQIVVPNPEEAQTVPAAVGISAEPGAQDDGGLVNLNTATKEELMTLPGIGESRAEDIIRYREESGGFRTIEDIMKVSGIKNASFEKMKGLITV